MPATILIVVLILMLLGAVPKWPHSKNWATTRAADLACSCSEVPEIRGQHT